MCSRAKKYLSSVICFKIFPVILGSIQALLIQESLRRFLGEVPKPKKSILT